MKHDFLKNAKVEVKETNDKKGDKTATVVIDDKYEHTFPHKSRIVKNLQIMTPEQMSERLTGGHYFFVEDKLYDFREGNYKGFIQNDETILQLIDLLGINEVQRDDMRVHDNVTSPRFKLGKKWSDHPISVAAFKDGGEFRSELHYGWSPFMKTINSAFKLERLICTNGMRGMRSFMNTKIPLVNRWSEHLDMANMQIQNKVDAICTRRFAEMANERASVGELVNLASHAEERIVSGNDSNRFVLQNERLRNLRDIVNPREYLKDVYQSNVFKKGGPAGMQYPGHLTTLDAFNIATEIRSHSKAQPKSTTRALDMIANDLVFDHKNIILPSSGKVSRKLSAFSDPDAAFFGAMA
jgi:hypothetical protein